MSILGSVHVVPDTEQTVLGKNYEVSAGAKMLTVLYDVAHGAPGRLSP